MSRYATVLETEATTMLELKWGKTTTPIIRIMKRQMKLLGHIIQNDIIR